MRQDIQDYLAELEDIPGTRIYTTERARQGYWLNQFWRRGARMRKLI